jgi:hypothetical protein
LEGATLAGPHRDKWPHYNYFGKGGLIFHWVQLYNGCQSHKWTSCQLK